MRGGSKIHVENKDLYIGQTSWYVLQTFLIKVYKNYVYLITRDRKKLQMQLNFEK